MDLQNRTGDQPPLMGHEQIKKIIPHRAPMLLIDEVTHLIPGKEIVATYFVPKDLPLFRGHFPDAPVLPGVYTIESLAQAADIVILSLSRYEGKQPLLLGVRDASFQKKILPGDTVEMRVSALSERLDKGIVTCSGQAFTDGELAAEAVITLAPR